MYVYICMCISLSLSLSLSLELGQSWRVPAAPAAGRLAESSNNHDTTNNSSNNHDYKIIKHIVVIIIIIIASRGSPRNNLRSHRHGVRQPHIRAEHHLRAVLSGRPSSGAPAVMRAYISLSLYIYIYICMYIDVYRCMYMCIYIYIYIVLFEGGNFATPAPRTQIHILVVFINL